jgi:hypothetical protein
MTRGACVSRARARLYEARIETLAELARYNRHSYQRSERRRTAGAAGKLDSFPPRATYLIGSGGAGGAPDWMRWSS